MQEYLQPLFVYVESGRLLTKEGLQNCPFRLPGQIQRCSKKLWITRHLWSGFTSTSTVFPLQVPEPTEAHAKESEGETCPILPDHLVLGECSSQADLPFLQCGVAQ